jgi:hypothetical protein
MSTTVYFFGLRTTVACACVTNVVHGDVGVEPCAAVADNVS